MSNATPSANGRCVHDPFRKQNSLVVEAHWAAGVRVRCKSCGVVSHVSQRGRVRPDEDAEKFLAEHAND